MRQYLGDHDGGLGAVLLVEVDHLAQGVLADDVGVEDEEGFAGAVVQLLPGQCERACGAHGLRLLRARDLDAQALLEVPQEVHHHLAQMRSRAGLAACLNQRESVQNRERHQAQK
jgi:hypothetical protein